jgi:hypothetical protein
MMTGTRSVGFGERMRRGWQLTKASLRVVKQDKHLLVFPVLSGIGFILALSMFAGLFHFVGATDQASQLFYVFAWYFVSYFIVIYFNTALVIAVMERLDGRTPTLGVGLSGANSRIGQILGWTLLAATVGLLLQILRNMARDQRNPIGQILASLAGVAWSVITYFVIPVIVVNRMGPIAAVKESARTMRRTWGESLAGTFSMGFIFFLFYILAFIIAFVAWNAFAVSPYIGGLLLVAAILFFVTVLLVQTTAKQVLVAALYRYATKGDAGGVLSPQQARATFNPDAQWIEYQDPATGRIRGA